MIYDNFMSSILQKEAKNNTQTTNFSFKLLSELTYDALNLTGDKLIRRLRLLNRLEIECAGGYDAFWEVLSE